MKILNVITRKAKQQNNKKTKTNEKTAVTNT